jgi:aspartate aminotransferase
VLLDTISKRYSACGARIGAFITRNEALLQTALKFAQARLSPPTLEQILAEAAIDLAPNYFNAIKQEYLLRRNLLVQRLQAMPQVVCPNPGGAFYAMAQLPVADTDVFCQWLLEEFQYHNQTIMMAPGSGFYSNAELGKKEVRLAYVLQQENIQKAMDCLEEALKIYNQ